MVVRRQRVQWIQWWWRVQRRRRSKRQLVTKMRTHHFLRRLDHNRVTQAIKKAEGKSSGQIRVFIQRGKFEDDALLRAERRVLQLGMQQTRDRNAVLIFVAQRAHKYGEVEDFGVHEQCGQEFWKKLVHDMRSHFKNQDFKRA